MTAFVIADLGFGDAGKGTITDFLVRRFEVSLVVRYNGGAQAGHTVETSDGRHFTFAQFSSGTLVPHVRTHLSRFRAVHPTGLLVEADRLRDVGVTDALDRISISPDALIITPFHQAAGRLREQRQRHGSCGVGVGETVRDSLEHPEDTITAGEIGTPALAGKLARIRERKRAELEDETPDEVADRWIDALRPFVARVRLAADDEAIPKSGSVVFEGAHGVLLDEWRGFHPHTTWHTCTFEHAHELLRGFSDPVTRVGVLRTYATRHGLGPFPTEDLALDLPEPHNPPGEWQGAFRRGWLDAVLAKYAITACRGVDRLAITHLDRLASGWQMAASYAGTSLALGPPHDLAHQEALGNSLRAAQPEYVPMPHQPDAFLAALEHTLEAPVWIASHGPRAEDKRERCA